MTFALAQFRLRGASDVRSRLGAVIDGRLVDLTAADAHLTDLSALIAGGDKGLAHARQAATSAAEVDQAKVEWLPPIGKPGKIVCLGLNYAAHAAEGGNKAAEYPSFFMRTASGLIGHCAPLIRPPVSEQLDFEAELAVVIGRRARHLSVADALTAVAGYACFNDGTIRDYQRKTSQWTIGKNFDGTGAFGPWFVPAAELPAGAKGLKIESRLNGQVMQSDNTANMIVPVAETLQLLTEVMTLEPGDVIIMGTPAGVGYARKPPVWMKPGDTIEIDIEGIGILSNPIVDEVK
jgi:acylpyruvate hydrolase